MRTAAGVNLSKEEMDGILEAVTRRMNRLAVQGHPAAGEFDASTFPQAAALPLRDQGQGVGQAPPLQPPQAQDSQVAQAQAPTMAPLPPTLPPPTFP